jgi:hypothetical protein
MAKPGRKPGSAKVPGSGRKPGSLNKNTVAFRSLAQSYAPAILKRLAEIAKDKNSTPLEAEKCGSLVLAYGHGKPKEMHEVSGPDGGAITIEGVNDALSQLLTTWEQRTKV